MDECIIYFNNFALELKIDGLNLELFIAKRMLRGEHSKGAVSVPIVKIAVTGIAVGITVMLLSVFIIMGFKREITDKLSGFMAHLDVTSSSVNSLYSGSGFLFSDTLLQEIRKEDGVKQAYVYVNKPAILKSNREIQGVVLKGVDSLFDAAFFKKHLREGEFPDFSTSVASNDILLSASIAALLGVECGGKVNAHFVQDPPRVRVFTVKGIYDTGFKEYDDVTVVCDRRHLQRLNGWNWNEVSGVAVELYRLDRLNEKAEKIDGLLPSNEEGCGVRTLYQTAPQIFDWLEMLNMNVVVILTLIILVAGFNMVSGLLIFILDKTAMIGILKALGVQNFSLRKVFLYVAAGMIVRGLFWGNVLALGLAFMQYYGRFVKLDATVYYMDTVPIDIHVGYVVLLNVGVLFVSVLMLVIPTLLISRITPIKAIRFE